MLFSIQNTDFPVKEWIQARYFIQKGPQLLLFSTFLFKSFSFSTLDTIICARGFQLSQFYFH